DLHRDCGDQALGDLQAHLWQHDSGTHSLSILYDDFPDRQTINLSSCDNPMSTPKFALDNRTIWQKLMTQ
ncbi:MAG TPA: hypothetical protein VG458_03695, partial [Solirubrobacterales bacterium]|nr:hypothetical protein [Solirubrobacterales bacterium]